MSTHDDKHNHGHNQHGHGEGVESSVIQPKPIAWFLVILTIVTIFSFFLIKGIEWGFEKMRQASEPPPPSRVAVPEQQKLPPLPRLQGAPEPVTDPKTGQTRILESVLPLEEMENFRNSQEKLAASYGWVDKDGGFARIPIEKAKDIIAERGLPQLKSENISAEVQAAEAARKQVVMAGANAGRSIKK